MYIYQAQYSVHGKTIRIETLYMLFLATIKSQKNVIPYCLFLKYLYRYHSHARAFSSPSSQPTVQQEFQLPTPSQVVLPGQHSLVGVQPIDQQGEDGIISETP